MSIIPNSVAGLILAMGCSFSLDGTRIDLPRAAQKDTR